MWEITGHIREMLEESGVKNGFVNVISRHTTTGPPPPSQHPAPIFPARFTPGKSASGRMPTPRSFK